MNPSKKRILFNIHYLEIGGVETSLIGLLHNIDYSIYNVDLFINDPRGEMMKYIPSEVNVLSSPKAYRFIERPMVETLRKGYLAIVVGRLLSKMAFSLYKRHRRSEDGSAIFGYVGKYVTPFLPSLRKLGNYDIAISYLTPHNIVLKKILAKKKVAWIHTDYSAIDVNPKIELPVWDGYDKIVSISASVTDGFVSKFPTLKNKIVEIENFLPEKLILEKSKEFIPSDMPKEAGIINLLTIGRYCFAKRIDEIPLMALQIKKRGIRFKWYIIGYGPEEEEQKIESSIDSFDVKQEMILLGKKNNPYPYIKACDFYVQPSRYEGKSITVSEAQLLDKTVIVANYPTASSQINEGENGYIGPYPSEDFANYLVDRIQLL